MKREIRFGKFMIVLSFIVMLATRVAYTKLAVSYEQATGEQMLRMIPDNPVTRLLHFSSLQRSPDKPGKNNDSSPK
ncbi:MAG: hypothetical protein QM802_11495 [Agriterribacter sp.]